MKFLEGLKAEKKLYKRLKELPVGASVCLRKTRFPGENNGVFLYYTNKSVLKLTRSQIMKCLNKEAHWETYEIPTRKIMIIFKEE